MNKFDQQPQINTQESPADRQERALAIAKKKFDEAVEDVDNLRNRIEEHLNSSYVPGSRPVFSEPVGDGGMDIQDRIVEEGSWKEADRDHDYYISKEANDDLRLNEEKVADLHEAMTKIEDGDEAIIQEYSEGK